MRSVDVAYYEKQNLISWRRTEVNLVGYLKELYFNMRYSGCYVCRKTFRIRRKGIPTIQLLLTLECEGRMRYREKDYCLTPGSAMLISLSEMHEYHAVTDG